MARDARSGEGNTGTPSGVGFTRKPPVFLMPGDTVDMTVEEIGTLSNPVELYNLGASPH